VILLVLKCKNQRELLNHMLLILIGGVCILFQVIGTFLVHNAVNNLIYDQIVKLIDIFLLYCY
jgi:hypothetical protein